MHVIVVGCGRVGAGLVARLEERGHSVAVIDRRATAFRRLPSSFRGRRIEGVGFDRSNLEAAGIGSAGGVAAVTNGDNSNIVVARIAKEAFGVPHVVARIYDGRRAAIYERLGVPTVANVEWSTDRVLRRILPEDADIEWSDPTTAIQLVERPIPEIWAGSTVAELEQGCGARVVALTRLGTAMLADPAQLIETDDRAWLAVNASSRSDLARRLARVGDGIER